LAGHPVTRLEAGAPANLIQFNLSEDPSVSATAALEIVATIIAGEVVYGRGRVA
jgi:hypothetical protein